MLQKALWALAVAFLAGLLMGGLGVLAGFLLGAMLRLMWGLLAFLATGAVVSLVPQTDLLRVATARAIGAVGFVAGAMAGSHEGWHMNWNMEPSDPWTDDENTISPMGL